MLIIDRRWEHKARRFTKNMLSEALFTLFNYRCFACCVVLCWPSHWYSVEINICLKKSIRTWKALFSSRWIDFVRLASRIAQYHSGESGAVERDDKECCYRCCWGCVFFFLLNFLWPVDVLQCAQSWCTFTCIATAATVAKRIIFKWSVHSLHVPCRFALLLCSLLSLFAFMWHISLFQVWEIWFPLRKICEQSRHTHKHTNDRGTQADCARCEQLQIYIDTD